MQEKILIVDDEKNICELLKLELEMEGYVCDVSYDGEQALLHFSSFHPDLILLDQMLPKRSGIEVLAALRQYSDIPVILLTAKSEINEKIIGLEAGADDYITKPFDMGELLARIKALIRRSKKVKKSNDTLKNGDLVLIVSAQNAFINDNPLKLTATEFDILRLLLENKEQVFSRQVIAEKIGLKDFQTDTRSIDMHIQRLRRKLSRYSDERYIETIFGIGYKMKELDT